MSNSRRQRRDQQQNWSTFQDKPYLVQGPNPHLQMPSHQYGKGDPAIHEKLARDRHWILEQNYPYIRLIASKMAQDTIVMCVVDHAGALGKVLGSLEAGKHYQEWRASRCEFALTLVVVPWANGDAALVQSRDWPRFKELVSKLGLDTMIPTVVISGQDQLHGQHKGSHLGYTFAGVPREGEVAPEPLDGMGIQPAD